MFYDGYGKLTVPTPGVYFVYSQLYYTALSGKSLIYYVCVNSVVKVMSVQSGGHSLNTLSHSFLVLLNAQDVITVKLGDDSSRAFLVENASFFGAFLV